MASQMSESGMKDPLDIQEAVMIRTGEILEDFVKRNRGRDKSQPHKFLGIELMAKIVANHVMDQGASKLASMFNVNLARLKEHVASEQISSC